MTGPPFIVETGAYRVENGAYVSSQIIDDFERGNLDPWTDPEGAYSLTTETVVQGSYALECTAGSTQVKLYSMPGDGLPNYPERGTGVTGWWRTDTPGSGASTMTFNFAVSSDFNDKYSARRDPGSDRIQLRKAESGNGSLLAEASHTFSDKWRQDDLQWRSGGDIDWSLLDASGTELVSLTATDTDYDSGGIAFLNNNNATTQTTWADDYRVVNL